MRLAVVIDLMMIITIVTIQQMTEGGPEKLSDSSKASQLSAGVLGHGHIFVLPFSLKFFFSCPLPNYL